MSTDLLRGREHALMFGVGQMKLLIIAFIWILLFGNRLPKLMRDLGRGLTEFKRGLHDGMAIASLGTVDFGLSAPPLSPYAACHEQITV